MNTVSDSDTLRERLAAVRARIARAAEVAGRDPASITLIGISKGKPAELARDATRCGLNDLGENRVQEAIPKAATLADTGLHPRWHMVGHLQRNKVATAIATFDVIHSVDSLPLLERIARLAHAHPGPPPDLLIEVNVSGEASKHGVTPENVENLLCAAESHPHLRIRGLMTVAPQCDNPEDVRPVFRELAAMAGHFALPDLSMGMTGDFEVAIEEGTTMVRVGRAIFGERH